MHPYVSEQLWKAHRADLLARAELERLARAARIAVGGSPASERRVRRAVGTRLVRVGLRLAGTSIRLEA